MFFVFLMIVFNVLKNQISKNEFLTDPLKKIEKEIIRAAKTGGIDLNENEELIKSLKVIYNRDLKIILDKIYEEENSN